MTAWHRFVIRGHGPDADIEHEIELQSDGEWAFAYLAGYIEALYPGDQWDFDTTGPDVIGNVLEYEVHVYRR